MALTKVTSGVRTLGTGEVVTANINDGDVTTAKMATDPTNASNLASGSVPLARLGNVDTSGITANQDDIALLGFKVAANGSLAKYNLIDQTIDAFEDASGVDASASTNETRDALNYYAGTGTQTVTSTGGDAITTDGDYTIHKFTSDGTYETDVEQTDYELLLVGGGGAGGNNAAGGGGGGGGFNTQTDVTVTAATHAVVVGAGGARATSWYPSSVGTPGNGGDSTFADGATTWYGYGGGKGGYPSAGGGGSGYGSGGGEGATLNGAGAANTQNGSVGYAGGDQDGGYRAGGGGGASAAGSNASGSNPGDGGAGQVSDILITDSDVRYGGGGGGGNHANGPPGSGGSGGGANGNGNNNTGYAPGGVDGQGGGGGGAAGIASPPAGGGGGNGGSGVVIIRRPTVNTTYNNMTLVSNATTAVDGAPTTGDLVITYTDGAGTASVNTDIKAYISRNGSAYTSAVNLVSQGTTGGHTILTANGVDLSGITTGTSMRWKIETLNQSVSKQTRVQAASLGWS